MEMLVLGCSGSVPGPSAAASGYFLRSAAGEGVVVDLGSGVLKQMQRYEGIDPSDCHVVLSHMHADHCSDVPSLLVWRRYHPFAPASTRHKLIGPSIAAKHIGQASADSPEAPDDLTDTFEVLDHVVGPESDFDAETWRHHTIGDLRIYAVDAIHPTEAYIIRFEDSSGFSVVYSGDTAPTPALARIAAGADVLVCEATWGDGGATMPEGMHLSGAEAGEAAQAAGVGRLVLTHIPPWGDKAATVAAAARHYTGPIEVARPGLRISEQH